MNILTERTQYFDMILYDINKNYNPNTHNLLKDYLPKIKVLTPSLHDTLSSLYEKMRKSQRGSDQFKKNEDYQRYVNFRERLVEYVKSKKIDSTLQNLSIKNLWGKAFSQASNDKCLPDILEAFDQIEDCLWLANNIPSNESPTLVKEIDTLAQKIDSYCKLIELGENKQKELKETLVELKSHSEKKEFEAMKQKASLIAQLIQN